MRHLLPRLLALVPMLAVGAAPLEAWARGGSQRNLKIPRFAPAVFLEPIKTRTNSITYKALIALHGNFDRPSWQCEEWAKVVRGRAFLLCPRGMLRRDAPRQRRFTYRSTAAARRELEAGLAALRRRFPGKVESGPPALLMGFSLGATYASRMAAAAPQRYPRVLLLEGGHTIWTAQRARRFRRKGGKSVAFGCGTRWCARRSKKTCKRLRRAKVSCRFAYAPGLGHSYGPALTKRLQEVIDEALKTHRKRPTARHPGGRKRAPAP